jgi:hypothetical protein
VGFALDYYPDEKWQYARDFGRSIIGDFSTREAAEAAVAARLLGRRL